MKLLKIENSLGYYLNRSGEYEPIDKIGKEQLLRMVDITLKEKVELDEYNGDAIRNQAHQIIYKSVYEKLKDLSERKDEFIDESERLYLEDYERYKSDASQQG